MTTSAYYDPDFSSYVGHNHIGTSFIYRAPTYSTTAVHILPCDYALGTEVIDRRPVYQRAGYRSPLPSIRAMVEQAKQDAFCRMHLSAALEAQRARHPFVARASPAPRRGADMMEDACHTLRMNDTRCRPTRPDKAVCETVDLASRAGLCPNCGHCPGCHPDRPPAV